MQAAPIPVPPRELYDVGPGDFRTVGDQFLTAFTEFAGLKPDERVLDVGCGVGRMAVPLTRYLEDGTYDGFDISRAAVDWCTENITSRFPRFRFCYSDIQNGLYNPSGEQAPETFRFPYGDGAFDFVFLTSVFTHMLPAAVDHYLSEIRRVLRPRGRSLITYFLLNEESFALISARQSEVSFPHDFETFRASRSDVREAVIGYPESYVMQLYERHGMAPRPPAYGRWCGRQGAFYQDIVVADLDAVRVEIASLDSYVTRVEQERDAAERDALRTAVESLSEKETSLRAELREERDRAANEFRMLNQEASYLRARLAAADDERDHLAGDLLLVAGSGLGRVQSRWRRFASDHRTASGFVGRASRAIWLLVTLQVPRGLRANPLFDPEWYLQQYPDVRTSRLSPYRHYWRHGVSEGRDPNRMFAARWYLDRYGDVRAAGIPALDHYLEWGWRELRDPSPAFDTRWYLRTYPDVLRSGMNPLLHYLRYGANEGRTPCPPSNARTDTRARSLSQRL